MEPLGGGAAAGAAAVLGGEVAPLGGGAAAAAAERLVLRISPAEAVQGSLAITLFFVGALHLWKFAGYRDENRDATSTIQRRFLSSILACMCSACLIFAKAVPALPTDRGHSFTELLGLSFWTDGWPCVRCLLLTVLLFLGPIVQHFLAGQLGYSMWFQRSGTAWMALRNYVIAPVSEELVFRACLVRLWVAASFPMGIIIFLSPFCFALAHTHHFVEHVRRHGDKTSALIEVAFQVFYTSLFGMFSNFLLLRTGTLPAVIVAHSFCNLQGFPDLRFLTKAGPLSSHRRLLGVLYLLGIVLFAVAMAPLTAGFDSSFRSADS